MTPRVMANMAELVRRGSILVPIDLHGINPATLETLVLVARRLDRTLLGLFLEDLRLQQVADLPFTTEIVLGSGEERGLLREQLAQRQSSMVEETRRRLRDLASRDRVELTFENAAGARLHTALERDGELDIFFPARQRWRLVSATSRPARLINRLGLLLDNGPHDQRVLETAHVLVEAGLVTDVYVLSDRGLNPDRLSTLTHPGTRVCVQSNLTLHPDTITGLIRNSAYDLLLLPRDCLREVRRDALEAALESTPGQVLVVT
jgi:hypothetical protein